MASCLRYGISALVAICLLISVYSEEVQVSQQTYTKEISRSEFAAFAERSSVSIVYFFKKDVLPICNFLKEYEKSAQLLAMYDVQLAKLDCLAGDTSLPDTYCDKEDSEDNLYAFRDGHELLALPLENTFDVNSIMSNILQIVLLREVPILQTYKERSEFEEQNKGFYDVILSYQAAIGTYEHRALMEVAFAYQHKYKFVITTEKSVTSDLIGSSFKENSMLWVLHCKSTPPRTPCSQTKFVDNNDLVSLARFLRALDAKLVHSLTDDGASHPYDDLDLHKVVIFYPARRRQQADVMAERVKVTFGGMVGVILVDVTHPDAGNYGYVSGVTKHPSVAMILRGTDSPITMVGEFTALSVEAFILRTLQTTTQKTPGTLETETLSEEAGEEELLEAVEKQDDQVAEAVTRLSHIELDRKHVPVLTDETFPKATTQKDLCIVLFYVTFDAPSMAFMHSYVEAAEQLAAESLEPLAAVNCFDWTDVCSKNNITSYPTIRIYRKHAAVQDYRGMLGTEPIISLVKLLRTEAPVVLGSHQMATLFLQGLYPSKLKEVTDVSVLGIFSQEHEKELASFKEAAVRDHGKIVYGIITSDTQDLQFKVQPPAMVVYKRHDMWSTHRALDDDTQMTSTDDIMSFIKEAALPVFPELTPMNFPAYFRRGQPLVLLFDEHIRMGKDAHAEVAAVVPEFPSLTFAWMELTRDDGVAGKVLLEYNHQAEPPSLFLVNHSSGLIYNYGDQKVLQGSVKSWLMSVLSDEATPWRMLEEGEWKPLNPGYDFLKMIDEENADDEEPQFKEPAPAPSYKPNPDLMPPGESEESSIREELQQIYAASRDRERMEPGGRHTEL